MNDVYEKAVDIAKCHFDSPAYFLDFGGEVDMEITRQIQQPDNEAYEVHAPFDRSLDDSEVVGTFRCLGVVRSRFDGQTWAIEVAAGPGDKTSKRPVEFESISEIMNYPGVTTHEISEYRINPEKRIIDAHNDYFGEHTGSDAEPYFVFLFGDDLAGQPLTIDTRNHGQDLGRQDSDPEPIYGMLLPEGNDDQRSWERWSEPCLGIAFSYNRDFRWAYIGTEDPSDDVHVERIGGERPLSLFFAREDDYKLITVKTSPRFNGGELG